MLPFFVVTKMTRIKKPTLDKPTPERYVAAELTTVGLQSQTNGYFPHAVMVRDGNLNKISNVDRCAGAQNVGAQMNNSYWKAWMLNTF